MLHIWVRSVDSGPSCGTAIVEEVVDLRELNVRVDDLREMCDAVGVRVDTLPGIFDWSQFFVGPEMDVSIPES